MGVRVAGAWLGASVLALALLVLGAAPGRAQTDTLAAVRAKGVLTCGVSGRSKGFSFPDAQGVMRGLDADYCRAVAAAVFGDAEKVRFVALTPTTRFTALQSGEVDLVNANATWTAAREAQLGLSFASIYFFDGGSIMVRKDSGITGRDQLNGGSFCINPGGTAEQVLTEFAKANNIQVSPVNIDGADQLAAAFISGRCDAMMNDLSALEGFRSAQGANRDKFVILPGEPLYKDPLGSVVRANDTRWFNIVRWAHYVMVTAEELGVTSRTVDGMAGSADPAVRRLLGLDGTVGASFGLDPKWPAAVIRQVGNYGEVFERDIAPLGIARGANALARQGGLQYAPPYR